MVFLVRTKKSNICHKRIEHHERRIANDIIHKITKEIVNRAIAQIHLKLAENVVKEEQERYKDFYRIKHSQYTLLGCLFAIIRIYCFLQQFHNPR